MEDPINAMGYSLANYWNDLVPKVNLDPIFGSPLRATEIQDLGKIVCGIVYDSDVNNVGNGQLGGGQLVSIKGIRHRFL